MTIRRIVLAALFCLSAAGVINQVYGAVNNQPHSASVVYAGSWEPGESPWRFTVTNYLDSSVTNISLGSVTLRDGDVIEIELLSPVENGSVYSLESNYQGLGYQVDLGISGSYGTLTGAWGSQSTRFASHGFHNSAPSGIRLRGVKKTGAIQFYVMEILSAESSFLPYGIPCWQPMNSLQDVSDTFLPTTTWSTPLQTFDLSLRFQVDGEWANDNWGGLYVSIAAISVKVYPGGVQ